MALAGAVVLRALWEQASPVAARRLAVAAAVVPLALVPLYRARNRRWVTPAEVSRQVLHDVRSATEALRSGHTLVLVDSPGTRASLESAFGTLVTEAVRLSTGVPDAHVWIDPPPSEGQRAGLPVRGSGGPIVRYWLRNGRLVPLDDAERNRSPTH